MAPKRHHNQQMASSPNQPPHTRGNNNSNIVSTTTTSSTSSNNNSNLPTNLPTKSSSSSRSTTAMSLQHQQQQQQQPSAVKKSSSSGSSSSAAQGGQDVLVAIWERYVSETPQRVKLLDTFMAFLVLVGALQFIYCVLVGNYPFNAFLSGFSATVGQFVLTASLRIQTNPENKTEFKSVSHERAFADFVFGSLILHFFCVNFIN